MRVRELYRRLFRFDVIGPAIVFVATVVGALVGLGISTATWPLAALAVGGIAAALWRILTGDRSRARDLVEWSQQQGSRQWTDATGLAMPMSADGLREWVDSRDFTRPRPAEQARALIAVGDLDRARSVLERATAKNAVDAADLAAARFELEYTVAGDGDYGPWQAAAARLKPESARRHRASMAVHQAATDAATGGQWLITLDKAAQELGPFEVEPRRRLLRLLYPIVPVLLGISAVEVAYWLSGGALPR